MEFKRKLYTRGSSYETTIPMPLLFSLDKKKKHEVVFVFEPETNKWFIKIEEKKQRSKASSSKESTNETFVDSENPDSLKTEFPLKPKEKQIK